MKDSFVRLVEACFHLFAISLIWQLFQLLIIQIYNPEILA